MAIGVDKLPDNFPIWRDFKKSGSAAFAYQGIAIGQALGTGNGRAEERFFGFCDVFPFDGFGEGIEFNYARISAQGAVVEDQYIPVCKHVGFVLSVDDAGSPCPDNVASVVVNYADDVVAAIGEEDVAGFEARVTFVFIGRNELECVVVRPVKGKPSGGAVQNVLPCFGRQTCFEVFQMLFAFPLPDQFFVSRNLNHIRVALEFRSQGRAHGFVERVDEQIAVVAHLIVVIGATAHAPDECAIGNRIQRCRHCCTA